MKKITSDINANNPRSSTEIVCRPHGSGGSQQRARRPAVGKLSQASKLTLEELLEHKRKMNKKYAQDRRGREREEERRLRKRVDTSLAVLQIYKKTVALLYRKLQETPPTWEKHKFDWYSISGGCDVKGPTQVEVLLPHLNEGLYEEIGNNPQFGRFIPGDERKPASGETNPISSIEDNENEPGGSGARIQEDPITSDITSGVESSSFEQGDMFPEGNSAAGKISTDMVTDGYPVTGHDSTKILTDRYSDAGNGSANMVNDGYSVTGKDSADTVTDGYSYNMGKAGTDMVTDEYSDSGNDLPDLLNDGYTSDESDDEGVAALLNELPFDVFSSFINQLNEDR